MRHYKLNGKQVVPCSLEEWALFFENIDNRRVARDDLGGRLVSTVFLGMEDQLFETMILGAEHGEEFCRRTSTWEEAEQAHQEGIIEALKK